MNRIILLTLFIVIFTVSLIYPQQDKSPNHPEKKFPTDDRQLWLQFSFNLNTATGGAGNAGAEYDGTYFYSTR